MATRRTLNKLARCFCLVGALSLATPASALPPAMGGNHAVLHFEPAKKQSISSRQKTSRANKPAWFPADAGPSTGDFKLLVIPIAFNDVTPSSDRSGNLAYLQDVFFGNDAPGEGAYPFPSLAQFYANNSFGKLQLSGTVLPWTTAAQTQAYYAKRYEGTSSKCFGLGVNADLTANSPTAPDRAGARDLVLEALTYAIQEKEINLNNYDNNGDGVVDGVVVLHSGISAELYQGTVGPSNACDYLYSHQYQAEFTIGSSSFDVRYIVVPERFHCPTLLCGEDADGDYPAGIGIAAHELGHVLGLPDLYAAAGQGRGVGYYSLMGWGIYGWNGQPNADFGPDVQPVGFDPWSCLQNQWCEATDVLQNECSLPLTAMTASGELLRYRLDQEGNEYYLVAMLPGNGDWSILGSNGITIFHADETQGLLPGRKNNNVCIPDQDPKACAGLHYWVSVEQKDGAFDLENDVNYGDGTDMWRLFDSFDPSTPPSSCSWGGDNCSFSLTVKSLLATSATLRIINDPSKLPPVPSILSVPVEEQTRAVVGKPYSFQPQLLQSPSADTTWHLPVAPVGMQIDAKTGLITWTPSEAGTFDVQLSVENCAGDNRQTWKMVVVEAGGGGCSAADTATAWDWASVLLALLVLLGTYKRIVKDKNCQLY